MPNNDEEEDDDGGDGDGGVCGYSITWNGLSFMIES